MEVSQRAAAFAMGFGGLYADLSKALVWWFVSLGCCGVAQRRPGDLRYAGVLLT